MVSWKGTSGFARVGLISKVKCVGGVRGRGDVGGKYSKIRCKG